MGHRGNKRFTCVWLLLPAPRWWYWLNGNAHAHTSGCADAPWTYTAPYCNIQHAPDIWRVQRATEHVASTIPKVMLQQINMTGGRDILQKDYDIPLMMATSIAARILVLKCSCCRQGELSHIMKKQNIMPCEKCTIMHAFFFQPWKCCQHSISCDTMRLHDVFEILAYKRSPFPPFPDTPLGSKFWKLIPCEC